MQCHGQAVHHQVVYGAFKAGRNVNVFRLRRSTALKSQAHKFNFEQSSRTHRWLHPRRHAELYWKLKSCYCKASTDSGAEIGGEDDCGPFVRSLLVAWFAYQNGSSLAAKVMVESVLEAYRNGWTVGRLQLELGFLSLQKQDEAMKQLQPLDNDMLLSFVASIQMVCQELRCPLHPGSSQPAESLFDPKLQGLQSYVRQTLQQYANGATLRQMQQQQRVAAESLGGAGGPGANPHMVLLQSLTRIVLLTIEVLQRNDLASPRAQLVPELRASLGMAPAPSPQPSETDSHGLRPSSYADHISASSRDLSNEALLSCRGNLSKRQVRWLAIQTFIAFMGATMGWALSFDVFVEAALLAYLSGATASELFAAIEPDEFEMAGELLRSQSDGNTFADVNTEAFRRWLSTSYATWALIGVPHAKAGSADSYGWAWAPGTEQDDDAILAVYNHYDFVDTTLKRMAGEAVDVDARFKLAVNAFNSQDEEELAYQFARSRQVAIEKYVNEGVIGAKVEDPDLLRSSSAVTFMAQQLGLVQRSRELVVKLQQSQEQGLGVAEPGQPAI